MPSDVEPLCPSCFARVESWTAASCPACKKSTPIAACDQCMKSRAGADVPEVKPNAAGGDQHFLCVDCMEGDLEQDASERMRDAMLAVVLTLAAVFWLNANSVFVYALFGASAACFVFWWIAVKRRREPAKHVNAAWSLFRKRLERELKKRKRQLAA